MKAKYLVNQLNRVHDSLVTAHLDRGLIQSEEGYLQMPPTMRLEYKPDDAPTIGTILLVSVEVVPGKPQNTPLHNPYVRRTVTAELELEIPEAANVEDEVKKVVEAINGVAMNAELVCAWTVEPD